MATDWRNIPSLTALRAFEATADLRSFSQAARVLNVTHAAVAQQVRALEEHMGRPLVQREGRGVGLTADGEQLAEALREGFGAIQRGLEALRAGEADRPVRVTLTASFAAQWLMPRLRRLIAAHPGLEVRLSASLDYPRFRNDEFDADICYGPPRQEGLHVLPLGAEIVTPLCAPAIAGAIRAPADLLEQDLIESEYKRVRWTAWFAANGLAAPRPRGSRFDRSFMAIAAAVDGLGVTLESTRLAEREIASGRLVAPLAGRAQDVPYVAHYLVYPPAAKHRKSVRQFRAWMAAELALPQEETA